MTEPAVEVPEDLHDSVPVEQTEHLLIPGSQPDEVINPVGADLAKRYPQRYGGARPSMTPRDPCPVCSHPTGDCSPHDFP